MQQTASVNGYYFQSTVGHQMKFHMLKGVICNSYKRFDIPLQVITVHTSFSMFKTIFDDPQFSQVVDTNGNVRPLTKWNSWKYCILFHSNRYKPTQQWLPSDLLKQHTVIFIGKLRAKCNSVTTSTCIYTGWQLLEGNWWFQKWGSIPRIIGSIFLDRHYISSDIYRVSQKSCATFVWLLWRSCRSNYLGFYTVA